MKHREIRNEFDKVVGIYLYRTRMISVIHDVPSKETFMSWDAGDEVLTLKQTKKLRRQLKTAIRRMKSA